ncbi:prepilin-type N-terminal cleavage/methylation domain-containing protein, partial [Campylobacter coli]
MKKFIKSKDTSDAFTLFELVLVVLILGLVISIA